VTDRGLDSETDACVNALSQWLACMIVSSPKKSYVLPVAQKVRTGDLFAIFNFQFLCDFPELDAIKRQF
jgi:hypothetical protein